MQQMPKYYFTALSPFFIREHPYITSAKGLGEWVVIIVIYARLRQAAGKSDAVVGFYTFAEPWVISVSRPLGK